MASRADGMERRGMTIGGVMGHAFAAIGQAPLLFFGASFALVGLPAALLATVMAASPAAVRDEAAIQRLMLPMVGGWLVVWIGLYMTAQAFLFRVAIAQIEGRPVPVGEHVRAALGAVLPLIGLAILLTLAVWVGTILFVIPGIMLALMWSVAAPALVAERTGVFAAFGRSRYLTGGARWRIFGLVVLVFAIYFIASALVGLASGAMRGLAGAAAGPSVGYTIVSVLLQTAIVAVWTAIQGALFVELRNWKDGPATAQLADIFA